VDALTTTLETRVRTRLAVGEFAIWHDTEGLSLSSAPLSAATVSFSAGTEGQGENDRLAGLVLIAHRAGLKNHCPVRAGRLKKCPAKWG